ncbi:hypothetical protein [Labedella endophytica]|uniref:Uncharacterized protein n=1 Tax=Labedella endophytica TaxID=1523160 RepID=A0A433JPX1_9MICO|nr:hypothetical protein [Labedella endophytica]RUQ98236.1 hypothetical protein ELQ94_14575 [Labedella endophytica]
MTEIDFVGGVKRSRYPWDAIVVRSLAWGFAAGNIAGALGIAILGFNFLSALAVSAFVGGLIGLGSALAGLLIGSAIWGLLGLFDVDIPRRASIATVVPPVLLTAIWFVLVITSGFAAELVVHTVLTSLVIVVTAVVLPWRMRRRFLAAIAADPGRIARDPPDAVPPSRRRSRRSPARRTPED